MVPILYWQCYGACTVLGVLCYLFCIGSVMVPVYCIGCVMVPVLYWQYWPILYWQCYGACTVLAPYCGSVVVPVLHC